MRPYLRYLCFLSQSSNWRHSCAVEPGTSFTESARWITDNVDYQSPEYGTTTSSTTSAALGFPSITLLPPLRLPGFQFWILKRFATAAACIETCIRTADGVKEEGSSISHLIDCPTAKRAKEHPRAYIEKSHLALGSFRLLILVEDGSVVCCQMMVGSGDSCKVAHSSFPHLGHVLAARGWMQ